VLSIPSLGMDYLFIYLYFFVFCLQEAMDISGRYYEYAFIPDHILSAIGHARNNIVRKVKYEVFPCCQVDDVNILEWYMFYNNATVDSVFKRRQSHNQNQCTKINGYFAISYAYQESVCISLLIIRSCLV
jgi:hypothetical protein